MTTTISNTSAALMLIASLLTSAPTAEAQGRGFGGFAAGRTWTIDRPGKHQLRRDFTIREGDAIVINADGVTLDLNGFEVSSATRGTGRGIVIDGATGVRVLNGKVSGFHTHVAVTGSENVSLSDLQITGDGLAPDGGPSEIGILLLDSRACAVRRNTVSSVNLGVFVRGPGSTGNRIAGNVIVGGATDSSNLLGICYNPAPGGESPVGPSGDRIDNNHIARFGFAVSVSEGSRSNLFVDNTFASFNGPFRDPSVFEAQGGSNAEFDNASVILSTP